MRYASYALRKLCVSRLAEVFTYRVHHSGVDDLAGHHICGDDAKSQVYASLSRSYRRSAIKVVPSS